jgi:hypothetical protein
MYTIFSAVLRQQRKGDVMTSFGLSARSAVYIIIFSIIRVEKYYLFLSCCDYIDIVILDKSRRIS